MLSVIMWSWLSCDHRWESKQIGCPTTILKLWGANHRFIVHSLNKDVPCLQGISSQKNPHLGTPIGVTHAHPVAARIWVAHQEEPGLFNNTTDQNRRSAVWINGPGGRFQGMEEPESQELQELKERVANGSDAPAVGHNTSAWEEAKTMNQPLSISVL